MLWKWRDLINLILSAEKEKHKGEIWAMLSSTLEELSQQSIRGVAHWGKAKAPGILDSDSARKTKS